MSKRKKDKTPHHPASRRESTVKGKRLAKAEGLMKLRRWAEALMLCREEAASGKNVAEALRTQAVIFREQGDHGSAVRILEELISRFGETAGDLFAGAYSLAHLGRLKDAAMAYGRVAALEPRNFDAHLRLAEILIDLGYGEGAEKSFRNALQIRPDSGLALRELGILLHKNGKTAESQAVLERALSVEPDNSQSYLCLGSLLQITCRYREALDIYRKGLEVDPRSLRLLNNAGILAHTTSAFEEALRYLDRALTLDPAASKPYSIRGGIFFRLHRFAEGIADFRQALSLEPLNLLARSKWLLNLHYLDTVSAAEIFLEHQRFGELARQRFGPPRSQWKNTPDPDRRLRIGYLSPDFRNHSVSFFFQSVLSAHDRSRFELFGYSCVENPDAVTAAISRQCDHWRNVLPYPDEQVARMVEEDQIDILVDLAGHSGETRLLALTTKPAPVQVTWLGYPDTTGLSSMDYRLTDELADPTGSADTLHTETLLRLPRGFLCYTPPADAPPVSALPWLSAHRITFGSFNNFDKVSPVCLRLFASVLKAYPGARLMMKAKAFDSAAVRSYALSAMAELGVSEERLDLLPQTGSQSEHLALYSRVDLALDTYPYHGTTTTLEALYMGVPVVSLVGETHASRVGLSILTRLGYPEWAAVTPESFLEAIQRITADSGQLALLRASLRTALSASPLMDAPGFTRSLEEAFTHIWSRWCGGEKLRASASVAVPGTFP